MYDGIISPLYSLVPTNLAADPDITVLIELTRKIRIQYHHKKGIPDQTYGQSDPCV